MQSTLDLVAVDLPVISSKPMTKKRRPKIPGDGSGWKRQIKWQTAIHLDEKNSGFLGLCLV